MTWQREASAEAAGWAAHGMLRLLLQRQHIAMDKRTAEHAFLSAPARLNTRWHCSSTVHKPALLAASTHLNIAAMPARSKLQPKPTPPGSGVKLVAAQAATCREKPASSSRLMSQWRLGRGSGSCCSVEMRSAGRSAPPMSPLRTSPGSASSTHTCRHVAAAHRLAPRGPWVHHTSRSGLASERQARRQRDWAHGTGEEARCALGTAHLHGARHTARCLRPVLRHLQDYFAAKAVADEHLGEKAEVREQADDVGGGSLQAVRAAQQGRQGCRLAMAAQVDEHHLPVREAGHQALAAGGGGHNTASPILMLLPAAHEQSAIPANGPGTELLTCANRLMLSRRPRMPCSSTAVGGGRPACWLE